MRESLIESKFVKGVESLGYMCLKFNSFSMNGVPDRIVLGPRGKVMFVELKSTGKKLRPLQLKRKRQFEALGFQFAVISSLDEVGDFLHFLKGKNK